MKGEDQGEELFTDAGKATTIAGTAVRLLTLPCPLLGRGGEEIRLDTK